jgi:uncharacterized lipoprotein YddW (UPF0748 family)
MEDGLFQNVIHNGCHQQGDELSLFQENGILVHCLFPSTFNLCLFRTWTILDNIPSEGRTYFLKLIEQLAIKYQPDGIHLDDYFYPYEGMANEDAATFEKYGSGQTIHEWRESNINQMVKEISYLLSTDYPEIKWGISPFGIWKSGTPTGIIGLSGASVTYGNALKWLSEKWVDYIAPQLYWAIGGNQDFKSLSNWWSLQLNGRHLYPGIAAYKAEPSMTSLASLYKAEEIPNQILHLRDRTIQGGSYLELQILVKLPHRDLPLIWQITSIKLFA